MNQQSDLTAENSNASLTYGRGQKVVNVHRNSECTIIVDRNEKFPELQAAMFQSTARV
mgnify:CR=1 FL=1|jgi:hypothetical protein|tara:strand:+ start:300 stop:473 length:174 start_codon:yes stop_codon:yes gene_type:complete